MKGIIICILVAISSFGTISVLSSIEAESPSETEDTNSTYYSKRCAQACTLDFSPVCAIFVTNLSLVEYPNYCTFKAEECQKPYQLSKENFIQN